MKQHLTRDEISMLVAGGTNDGAIGHAEHARHIRECVACRSEAERLREALALFRHSARSWSTSQEQQPRNAILNISGRLTLRRVGWTAAACACLLAGLTLPREQFGIPVFRHVRFGTPVLRQTSAISDAELLGQVDRELSEAVPPSMEPMALNQNRNQK